MLPFRHVGGHNPGQWIGLIDAVYGIGMTLMVLEMPKTLQGITVQYSNHPQYIKNFYIDFAFHIIDYIIIFLILYELWCFHKTILMASGTSSHRLHSHVTAIILVLVSFIPAFTVYLLDTESREILSMTALGVILPLLTMYFVMCILTASCYGFLAILARIKADGGDRDLLKLCRKSAWYRCLIFTAFSLSSLIAYNFGYVWFRPNLLALGYLGLSYHQDYFLRLIGRKRSN